MFVALSSFVSLIGAYKLNAEKVQVERQFSERWSDKSAALINVEKVEPR